MHGVDQRRLRLQHGQPLGQAANQPFLARALQIHGQDFHQQHAKAQHDRQDRRIANTQLGGEYIEQARKEAEHGGCGCGANPPECIGTMQVIAAHQNQNDQGEAQADRHRSELIGDHRDYQSSAVGTW